MQTIIAATEPMAATKPARIAAQLNTLADGWIAACQEDNPPMGDLRAEVASIVGKASPKQVAAAMGYQSRFKSNVAAMNAIQKSTVGRVGSYERAGA